MQIPLVPYKRAKGSKKRTTDTISEPFVDPEILEQLNQEHW